MYPIKQFQKCFTKGGKQYYSSTHIMFVFFKLTGARVQLYFIGIKLDGTLTFSILDLLPWSLAASVGAGTWLFLYLIIGLSKHSGAKTLAFSNLGNHLQFVSLRSCSCTCFSWLPLLCPLSLVYFLEKFSPFTPSPKLISATVYRIQQSSIKSVVNLLS